MKQLFKRFRSTIILGKDLRDTIVMIITLYLLYKDYDTTIANLLEIGNKTIHQIQSILELKEVKHFGKQVTKYLGNIAKVFQNRKTNQNTIKKCFNCYKCGHFCRDNSLPDKKLNKISNSQNIKSKSCLQNRFQA